MSFRTFFACATLLFGAAASASAQTVSLEFTGGRVNLVAENAPVRTILAEWERLGGTRIVNRERIAGAPVTLDLSGVTEIQALEVLLRNVSGYVMTPRQGGSGASTIGGILILPTSSAPIAPPPAAASSTPLPRPVPVFDEDPQDDRPGPRTQAQAPFLPAVQPANAPPPTAGQPPQPSRPSSRVTTLPGTSRPGEITPPPQQPQQQPQPQPAQR